MARNSKTNVKKYHYEFVNAVNLVAWLRKRMTILWQHFSLIAYQESTECDY